MKNWMEKNTDAVWSGMALIAGSALAAWMCRGTDLQQFALGLLCASVTMLVAMGIFEIVWQILVGDGDALDDKESAKDDRTRSAPGKG